MPGAKGDTGVTGPPGVEGDKGDTGVPGSAGDQGDKGEKGDTGAPGPQGIQGPQGAQGVGIALWSHWWSLDTSYRNQTAGGTVGWINAGWDLLAFRPPEGWVAPDAPISKGFSDWAAREPGLYRVQVSVNGQQNTAGSNTRIQLRVYNLAANRPLLTRISSSTSNMTDETPQTLTLDTVLRVEAGDYWSLKAVSPDVTVSTPTLLSDNYVQIDWLSE